MKIRKEPDTFESLGHVMRAKILEELAPNPECIGHSDMAVNASANVVTGESLLPSLSATFSGYTLRANCECSGQGSQNNVAN